MHRIVGLFLLMITVSLVYGQGGSGTIHIQKPGDDTLKGRIAAIQLEKGLKQRTTTSISDKFELKKLVVERIFYNPEGFITEIRDYFRNIKTRYEYDSIGRMSLRELTNTVLQQLIYFEVYSYPTSGQVLFYRISIDPLKANAKPDTLFKSLTLYDPEGKKLEEKRFEKNGLERTLFLYDSLERISRELTFRPGMKDSLVNSKTHTYSELGKEILTVSPKFMNGKMAPEKKKVVYTFDVSGNVEKEEVWKNDKIVSSKTFTMNEKGKPIELRAFESDVAGVNYSHHLYEYIYY